MFSLLYGFWEYIFRKEEFRILVVGIDKAGKTTLLEKLKSLYSGLPGLDPDKILPTVGLNVGRVEAHNSLLVFWDLGGQAGLRPIWDKYYSDSHGLVFTVDSSQPERFAEAKDALERALGSRDLFGAPILVFANKQVRPACCCKLTYRKQYRIMHGILNAEWTFAALEAEAPCWLSILAAANAPTRPDLS